MNSSHCETLSLLPSTLQPQLPPPSRPWPHSHCQPAYHKPSSTCTRTMRHKSRFPSSLSCCGVCYSTTNIARLPTHACIKIPAVTRPIRPQHHRQAALAGQPRPSSEPATKPHFLPRRSHSAPNRRPWHGASCHARPDCRGAGTPVWRPTSRRGTGAGSLADSKDPASL